MQPFENWLPTLIRSIMRQWEKRLGIYYILMLIVYTIIAAMVYAYQYNHSRKGKKYFSRLNKLECFLRQPEKEKNSIEDSHGFLLELKEGFKKFYNKYDTYLVPAVRFVMALVSFLMLNASIGYMSKLKTADSRGNGSIVCLSSKWIYDIFLIGIYADSFICDFCGICIDCTGNLSFNVSAVLPFYTEAGVSFSDYGTALLDKNAVPASNCGGAVL